MHTLRKVCQQKCICVYTIKICIHPVSNRNPAQLKKMYLQNLLLSRKKEENKNKNKQRKKSKAYPLIHVSRKKNIGFGGTY